MYREGAVTDRTSQKWLAKFCPGNFLWDNAPWSGRPAEVDREQIETLTDNNQLSIPQEIVDILKISKSIKLLVKIKKCASYFKEKLNKLFGHPNKIREQLLNAIEVLFKKYVCTFV